MMMTLLLPKSQTLSKLKSHSESFTKHEGIYLLRDVVCGEQNVHQQ